MSSTVTYGIPSPSSSAEGIRWSKEVHYCTTYDAASGTAIVVGDLVLIEWNASTSKFDKCKRHAAATVANTAPGLIYGIAMDASASDTKVIKLQVRGIVQASCEAVVGNNKTLAPSLSNTGRLEEFGGVPASTGAARSKVIAISMGNPAGAGLLANVLFDGISGFSAATSA